jgi:hypothetical protein
MKSLRWICFAALLSCSGCELLTWGTTPPESGKPAPFVVALDEAVSAAGNGVVSGGPWIALAAFLGTFGKTTYRLWSARQARKAEEEAAEAVVAAAAPEVKP